MHEGTAFNLLIRMLAWNLHQDHTPHPVLQAGIPETRAVQRALVPFARLLPPFNLGMAALTRCKCVASFCSGLETHHGNVAAMQVRG